MSKTLRHNARNPVVQFCARVDGLPDAWPLLAHAATPVLAPYTTQRLAPATPIPSPFAARRWSALTPPRAYGFPACWALRLRGTPPGLALSADSGSAFPFRQQGRHPQTSFSELNPPAHRSLCLRFAYYLTIANAKLEARMVSLFLSCRALSSPTICRFIPAHCPALELPLGDASVGATFTVRTI